MILEWLFPIKNKKIFDRNIFLREATRCVDTGMPTITALFEYRSPLVKQAIWELKFRGNKEIAKILAEILYDEIVADICEKQDDQKVLVIPIPSHKKRTNEKGFNQTFLLAEQLSFIDQNNTFNVRYDVLYKIKDTAHQTSLKDRSVRLKNLKDSFQVRNAEQIQNSLVILIDDVVTTGTTLNEAMQTLRKAGVKNVVAYTVGH